MFPIMGQNQQLAAYQEAIREEMEGAYREPLTGRQAVRFYFWRNQASYVTVSGRKHTKHEADATNMQKALEDALQGVLFDNDRDTWDIRSVIVEQGPEVFGKVLFSVEPIPLGVGMDLPMEVLEIVQKTDVELFAPLSLNNDWPPR